jgi:hypothetical protein
MLNTRQRHVLFSLTAESGSMIWRVGPLCTEQGGVDAGSAAIAAGVSGSQDREQSQLDERHHQSK